MSRSPDEPGSGSRGEVAARLRRFVDRYGWRAYALPVLAVITVLVLLDVFTADPSGQDAAASRPGDSRPATGSVPAPVPAPTSGTSQSDSTAPTTTAPTTFLQRGTGNLIVVPGGSAVLGSGPLRTFQVEVEEGIDIDAQAFARAVEQTLGDPRSWGADGRLSFQRVDTADYDFKVALVTPDNVESFCPGYGTEGYTSCRYQDRAVINLARWETAVPDYQGDIPSYRQYVVNHEVGHYLGHGHEACPGPGQVAPVMQQQTLGLEGCLKNPWPYPEG